MNNLDHQKKIPALGRLVDLGMLYDIYKDELIIGKTLWSQEEIKSNVHIVSCPGTTTEVHRGNSISEQSLAIKMDGHQKLNLLCNNVDLQGSAAYLKTDKYSKRQARVVLNHERKTQLRHLTMDHLKKTKISHPEILDEGIATHVVSGIEYGGKILMKFEQKVDEEETLEELELQLKVLVEKLKGVISVNTNGNMNGKTNGKKTTENITCNVYSDFPTEEYPSSYDEAVQFCKKLPSLTGNDVIGVPVLVYLWPLNNLRYSLKGKKKCFEAGEVINDALIGKACVNIEHLLSVFTECEDLIKDDNFPILKRQLTLFMEMMQEYTDLFKKTIAHLVRDRSADNDAFDAFLKQQEASVFSLSNLTKWLDEMKKKMTTLQDTFKDLKATHEFVNSEKLNSLLMSQNTYHLVCLVFKISSDKDVQLSNMIAFLKKSEMQKFEETTPPLDFPLIRAALERFMNLSNDNKRNNVVKFVATEEPLSCLGSSEKPGVCVRYYYKGKLKDENLMPLEKSQNLRVVNASGDSVELAWDESLAQLNDIKDKVQYKARDGEWQMSSVLCSGRTARIPGLKSGTKYSFRVRGRDQIFLEEFHKTVEGETEPASHDIEYIIRVLGFATMLAFFSLKVFLK